jgi:peptidoglycan/xylan/chitin deacetylase (PgdA/CDA1 family)
MNPFLAGGLVAGAGAALGAWGAVAPQSQLFGPTLRRTNDASAIALTFDDGPNPAVTPRLLDLLDRHGIRATFFLIGKYVRACPRLAAEIAARGHAIGNHTETHPNLIWLTPRRICEELEQCREAIFTATGREPRWTRPPFGFRGPQLNAVVRRAGYAGVAMWSLWAWDWKPQPPEPVIRRLRSARGGDVIVLHDGDHRRPGGDRLHTVLALEHWLPRWKDAGFRFVALNTAEEDSNRSLQTVHTR